MTGRVMKISENDILETNDRIYRRILIELIIYGTFLLIVSIVVLLSRSFYMYYFYEMIQNTFIKRSFFGKNDIERDFESITTVEDWWGFVNMAILEGIPGQIINPENTQVNTESIYESIILGPPRLRQLRVKNGTCQIHKEFKKYFRSCYGAYSLENEDINFKLKTGTTKYYSSSEIDGMHTWGILHFYRAGGYIEAFTFDTDTNQEILEKLRTTRWISRGSRLAILEFTVYNGNMNMFCTVNFKIEIPPTGSLIPSYEVRTYRLTYLWTSMDYFYFVCYGIFILQIIYYSVEEIYEMYKEKSKYFKQFWNWLDLAIIVIGYLSVVYIIVRFFYMNQLMEKYKKNPKVHLNLDTIGFWQFHYNNMMGICAFLVWIKILKYLSFNRAMMQFSLTLSRCSKDLFAFGFMFAIAFIAFAQLGYLLFGTEMRSFMSFSGAVFTMMRILLGDFEYDAMEKANCILGPIFFLVYIIFVFFILLNMFLAIINDTYSEVKSEVTTDYIKLGSYVKKILGKMCKWCCCGRDICKFKDYEDEDSIESAPKSQEQPKLSSSPKTQESAVAGKKRMLELPSNENLSPRQRKVIRKYFEAVDPDEKSKGESGGMAEQNRMNQRVQRLEDVMDSLLARLDALVRKLDSARMQGRRT